MCFGAAIISMVQDQLRLNILELASMNLKLSGVIKTDLGRLGAQVVSGIGWEFYNLAIPAIVFILIIIVTFKKFETKIVKKVKLLKFEIKFLENQNYAKELLAAYEVFNQKLIRITQIDKNQSENIAIFTVNMDKNCYC